MTNETLELLDKITELTTNCEYLQEQVTFLQNQTKDLTTENAQLKKQKNTEQADQQRNLAFARERYRVAEEQLSYQISLVQEKIKAHRQLQTELTRSQQILHQTEEQLNQAHSQIGQREAQIVQHQKV